VDEAMVRLQVDSRQETPATRPGLAKYEILRGRFYGELDPTNPHNTIITDLEYAPRNARGLVEYSATYAVAKPIDMRQASGVLLHDVPNRGFHLNQMTGDPHGHVRVVSGWQSDLAPAPGLHTATVPIARNPNGESIVGPTFAQFIDIPAGSPSVQLLRSIGPLELPLVAPASLDTRRARLFYQRTPNAEPVEIAPGNWAFADCRNEAFPGRPDAEFISVRGGFEPHVAYRLVYEAKDPKLQGIGFAATRDLISFLRYAQDASNPLAGTIHKAIAFGVSQAGNFLKTSLHLGFNADVRNRVVFDGLHLDIAARHVPLNVRFGVPGALADEFDLGSEGVLWWSAYEDRLRNLGLHSLLDRCNAVGTSPKIMETFGSAELWNLRASPMLVGTDATQDLPLPGNVRRYYFPSVMHGSSWNSGFKGDSAHAALTGASLRLPGNPNPSGETLRALKQRLIDWVVSGKEPPPSRFPSLRAGDLVAPTAAAMGWAEIPNAPVPDGKLNAIIDHDLGETFHYADTSGVVSVQPPRFRQFIPSLVPRVNVDGNETAGVPSVQLLVPIGTYIAWNEIIDGFNRGKGFTLAGGFIPFAKTKESRVASKDPRLSLEERYGDPAGFVRRVREVVIQQVAQGWLLQEDGDRLVKQAEESTVLLDSGAD
jgi:hypothetical protein